jgi:quinoprotein glucose dehydrogenase
MSDSRGHSLRRVKTVLLLAAGIVAITSGLAQTPNGKWWSGYGNGPDNSRYFASRQINKSNVSRLQVAWAYPYGDTSFGPIAVHGLIYGRGRNGSLVAVDAKTGKEIWIRENMNGMTSRGMNYWESGEGRDQRLIFALNSMLQELDAKTGKSIMTFGTNGYVDLRVGIDGRDPSTIGNIQSNTPGEVFENLIILGSATGEGYMSPPGDIRAYDVRDGKLVWTFHTVPRPGEFGYDTWPKDAWKYVGGNNNWGEMTIDTRRGIAYIPLGSPTYDFYGADRVGANLFGTSIVALDARTGKRRWHFQLVHHDLWDMDPSAAPQLTTIRHNGRNRDVVVVTSKTTWLYVFDRETGEPIWPIEERPVPQSEMQGEESWPTQPYPTNPPPHSRQSFTVDDISPYLSADEAEAFRKRLAAATNKGLFTPISFNDTVHIPTSNGGVLFGGAASEPNGNVYVVARDNPGILHLLRPGENAGRGGGGNAPVSPAGLITYQQNCQTCHGADRLGLDSGGPALIADNTPRFDAMAIRTVIASGKGRMPSQPHLTSAEVDNLVAFLTTAPAGGRGGRGGAATGSGAPPELVVGSGSVAPPQAGGARGRGAPRYPDGVSQTEQYVINEYNTVGNRIKPPYTSIVKYNLNEPSIKWKIGFGDDPALAARGIKGTGVAATLNGIIVTESGIVFGAGRDNQIRAWDSDTGKQLWSSRFEGNFVGSPVMYEMDGKSYLLVNAARGWVTYSLPGK